MYMFVLFPDYETDLAFEMSFKWRTLTPRIRPSRKTRYPHAFWVSSNRSFAMSTVFTTSSDSGSISCIEPWYQQSSNTRRLGLGQIIYLSVPSMRHSKTMAGVVGVSTTVTQHSRQRDGFQFCFPSTHRLSLSMHYQRVDFFS